MASYFYSVNDKKNGPFTFEELKKENIQRTTLIWKEGLTSWVSAENLDEFKDYFKEVPPAIPIAQDKLINKKIASEVITIEKTLIYSVLIGIIALVYLTL
ncbi:MAG: DUF4339 domain-containing protein [Chitinophagaceae bacterium]|nr:DUF4339 domain-containing protein [Chitinophagaceae bacterium]MCW5904662.1 DUF4339 domain-containing protein [Chitinophagaceae bacterium]